MTTKAQLKNKSPNTIVQLSQPFKRGEKDVASVALREPMGGDLRGVSLGSVLQMDVGAVGKVLERVSEPMVDVGTFASMSARDITSLSLGLLSFFVDTKEESLIE